MFLMSRAAAVAVFIAATVLMLVGAALNWYGAHELAPGEAASIIAIGAVCAEVIKLGWMAGAAYAWRHNMMAAALAVVVMGAALHTFSLVCALSLTGSARIEAVEDRYNKQENHARLETAYIDAKARVDALRGRRPMAEIKSELDAARKHLANEAAREAKERQTGCGIRCTAAIAEQRKAQARIDRLESELKAARELKQARTDMKVASDQLARLPMVTATDPQAKTIAALLPVPPERISGLLPLLPSLVVEFTPAIALWLAVILWSAGRPAAAVVEVEPIEQPHPQIEAAARVAEVRGEGKVVPITPEQRARNGLSRLAGIE